VTPDGLLAWHEKEPRGTHCGGAEKCDFCVDEARAREIDAARRAASEEGNRRVLAHLAGHIGEGEGQCGGYYHCPTCAAEIGRAKDAEAARYAPRPTRPLTREERAADRARIERRRAKAKAAKQARKLNRRRQRA
jgi:hypothetical protein